MTIKQCEYLIEIAKCGSFSAAADKLFVTQSNLSTAIKELENELGTVLFRRSSKGISLTVEGREFLAHAVKILEQVSVAKDCFRGENKRKSILVYTQHYDFMADVFTRFVNRHSSDSFAFAFKETKTAEIIKSIRNNSCDIGVIVIQDGDTVMERYLKNNHITFTKICETSPHVFMRKGHPKSKLDRISISDMDKYPFIAYDQGDYSEGLFQEELIEMAQWERTIEIYDRATLMNLLLSTDSFTVGTGIMNSELNSGNIVSIPLNSEEKYSILLITPENTVLSNEAEEFVNMLIQYVNK